MVNLLLRRLLSDGEWFILLLLLIDGLLSLFRPLQVEKKLVDSWKPKKTLLQMEYECNLFFERLSTVWWRQVSNQSLVTIWILSDHTGKQKKETEGETAKGERWKLMASSWRFASRRRLSRLRRHIIHLNTNKNINWLEARNLKYI